MVEGDEKTSWHRRIILKGSRDSGHDERTILEIRIQYELERFEDRDGRRIKQTSNQTHYFLTLHTVRSDETIREYGKAYRTHDRDRNVWSFPGEQKR